jgi:hypothetical protein
MPYLKSQGVTTIYMEHLLSEHHQVLLDEYMQSPDNAPMPPRLELYLKFLNNQFFRCGGYHEFNGFKRIVEEAKKNNIRIIAIDCDAAYQFYNDADRKTDNTPSRLKSMNMRARECFNQYDDGGKYIIFCGNAHAVNYHNILGLSEWLGCSSICIADTNKENPQESFKENYVLMTKEVNLSFDYFYYRNPDITERVLHLKQIEVETEAVIEINNIPSNISDNLTAAPHHLALFGNHAHSIVGVQCHSGADVQCHSRAGGNLF